MSNINKVETMARHLRAALELGGNGISEAKALDLISGAMGFDRENRTNVSSETPADNFRFTRCSPILRIFDERKAREFYCDFLGFEVAFEHRFSPDLPLYLGIERAGLSLHLSEHHGDASPGANVFVETKDIRSFHKELIGKQYSYGRPGLEQTPWGLELEVHDPFGNRIRFCEQGD